MIALTDFKNLPPVGKPRIARGRSGCRELLPDEAERKEVKESL